MICNIGEGGTMLGLPVQEQGIHRMSRFAWITKSAILQHQRGGEGKCLHLYMPLPCGRSASFSQHTKISNFAKGTTSALLQICSLFAALFFVVVEMIISSTLCDLLSCICCSFRITTLLVEQPICAQHESASVF